MAEAATQENAVPAVPTGVTSTDWEKLAQTLNVKTPEEAQKRAWEIANFVGGVDNDQNSELILRRGGMQVAIKLTK
jgi:hypothetical protein